MIYSLCGAPFIPCYFFISAHVMKSYTYFQRMAVPLPPSHLPVSCLTPSIFILHIYTLFCLYGVHLPWGSSQYHTVLSVCKQGAVQTRLGQPWWFWRLFLGCVSAGKAGSGAGPACSEGGLCLLGRCWLCLEHVTCSCTEGSKGSWQGFHKAAQSHGNWTHMLSFIPWG